MQDIYCQRLTKREREQYTEMRKAMPAWDPQTDYFICIEDGAGNIMQFVGASFYGKGFEDKSNLKKRDRILHIALERANKYNHRFPYQSCDSEWRESVLINGHAISFVY